MDGTYDLMYNPLFIVTVLVFGGLIVGFAGYKLFRLYSAVIGFAVGVILGYYVSLFVISEPSLWIYFATGVVLGIIFWLFYRVGLFLTGLIIGYMFLSSLLPEKALYAYVFAVLCGVLTLFLERVLVILITAFLGATAIVIAVEILLSGTGVYEFLLDPRSALALAFSSLSLFLLWFVMGVLGIVTQFVLTKETGED